MEQTLLLSAYYEPLTTISWQRAVCLLTSGKIEIVEEGDRELRSVHLSIKMPLVARLIKPFRRRKQRIKFNKRNVLARDRSNCAYCRAPLTEKTVTMDHVVPRAQGGKTAWTNIVSCCAFCNRKKGNRTPQEACMTLRKQPERPTYVPFITIALGKQTPSAWRPYCKKTGIDTTHVSGTML